MIACIVTEFLTYNVQCIYLQFQSFKGPKGPPGKCLQDNSPTNQLAVSQVADWSTRQQRIFKIMELLYFICTLNLNLTLTLTLLNIGSM